MSTPLIQAAPDDLFEVMDELTYQINRLGLEYADTFRVTPVEDGIEAHISKQSCCGAWEATHTCKSGRTYFIGCNHGH